MVIAPANTGSDNNNSIAVIKIAQTNKGSFNHFYYTSLSFPLIPLNTVNRGIVGLMVA